MASNDTLDLWLVMMNWIWAHKNPTYGLMNLLPLVSARLHVQSGNLQFLSNPAMLQTVEDARCRRAASARLDALALKASS